MKRLIKTILETSSDRIKNPIIGTFIIAFVAFNWRPFIYIILQSGDISNKIKFIDENYLSIEKQIWLPLIVTLIYALVIPYLMWIFEFLTEKATDERKKSFFNQKINEIHEKQKIAEQEIIVENIRANLLDKNDLNNIIEQYKQEMADKSELVKNLEDELNSFKIIMTNNDYTNPSKEQIELLNTEYELFKQTDIFQYFLRVGNSISNYDMFPTEINELIIEKYKQTDLFKEKQRGEYEQSDFKFNEKGKYFWKKYMLNIDVNDPKTQNNFSNNELIEGSF